MSSGIVRFVHRPITDKANTAEGSDGLAISKEPLIDRSTIPSSIRRSGAGGMGRFGSVLWKLFRVRNRGEKRRVIS